MGNKFIKLDIEYYMYVSQDGELKCFTINYSHVKVFTGTYAV